MQFRKEMKYSRHFSKNQFIALTFLIVMFCKFMQTALTTHQESEVKHLQEQLAEAQDRIQKQQLENQKVRKFLDLPKKWSGKMASANI